MKDAIKHTIILVALREAGVSYLHYATYITFSVEYSGVDCNVYIPQGRWDKIASMVQK